MQQLMQQIHTNRMKLIDIRIYQISLPESFHCDYSLQALVTLCYRTHNQPIGSICICVGIYAACRFLGGVGAEGLFFVAVDFGEGGSAKEGIGL